MRRSHRPHGPARLEKALSFEEVAGHRNLCCGLYGICLQVVVRRKWSSFSCRPCSLWSRLAHERRQAEPARVLAMPLVRQSQG